MRSRPDIISVFAIAVVLASIVNLTFIYFVTQHPRAVIQSTVEEAVATGKPTTMPRPSLSLDEALRKGDVEAVKQNMYWCLREHRCDLDKELHTAAVAKNPALAEVLIAAGAKVNAKAGAEGTPLHSAAAVGRTSVAEVLLHAGADANARDDEGRTPLHSAAAWGHLELVRVLLQSGSDVNATDKSGQTALHLVASRPVPPLAVYADVARMLLAAGARPNVRSKDGSTPLHVALAAASRLSLDGNLRATADANEVVSVLRERGGKE